MPQFTLFMLLFFMALPAFAQKGGKVDRLLEKGEFEDARRVLKSFIEDEPENPEYYLEIGRTYLKENRFAEALDYFKKAEGHLNSKPGAEVFFAQAFAYYKMDKFEESLKAVNLAIARSNAPNVDCFLLKGALLLEFKQDLEAEKSFKRALLATSEQWKVHYHIGITYSYFCQYQRAVNSFSEVLAEQPEFGQVYLERAKAYLEMAALAFQPGITELARRDIAHAEELNVAPMEIHLWRSAALMLDNSLQAALMESDTALMGAATEVDQAKVYVARGLLLARLKRFKEAMECCDKGISLDTANYYNYYKRGECYKLQGDCKKAKKDYKKCLQGLKGHYSIATLASEQCGEVSSSYNLVWLSPNPDLKGNELYLKTDTLSIQVKVAGAGPFAYGDFEMLIDEDVPAAKMPENGLVGDTYIRSIQLDTGEHEIRVILRKKGKIVAMTSLIKVIFRPNAWQGRLFVLSVGPHHEDLQFTEADARSFATLWQNQSGDPQEKLYEAVISQTLTGENASKLGIIKAIRGFAKYHPTSKDVLVFFISTHGFMLRDSLILEPTGFDAAIPEDTGLPYKRLLQELESHSSKCLVFMDACHSGGAKASPMVINEAIARLSKASSTSVITSSKENEASWEYKEGGHGAFTYALLEAFKGSADEKTTISNGNGDGMIDLIELATYLGKRVPQLKPQTPKLIRNNLSDTPFYIIYHP